MHNEYTLQLHTPCAGFATNVIPVNGMVPEKVVSKHNSQYGAKQA